MIITCNNRLKDITGLTIGSSYVVYALRLQMDKRRKVKDKKKDKYSWEVLIRDDNFIYYPLWYSIKYFSFKEFTFSPEWMRFKTETEYLVAPIFWDDAFYDCLTEGYFEEVKEFWLYMTREDERLGLPLFGWWQDLYPEGKHSAPKRAECFQLERMDWLKRKQRSEHIVVSGLYNGIATKGSVVKTQI